MPTTDFAKDRIQIEGFDAHVHQNSCAVKSPELCIQPLRHLDPNVKTGKHLEPEEFKKLKRSGKMVVILNVRSIEHELGHFRNASQPPILIISEDFPEKVIVPEYLKNKKVITYCTGGINAEKLLHSIRAFRFFGRTCINCWRDYQIRYGSRRGRFWRQCYVFWITESQWESKYGESKCDFPLVNVCGRIRTGRSIAPIQLVMPHVAICENCGWKWKARAQKSCKESPERAGLRMALDIIRKLQWIQSLQCASSVKKKVEIF